LQNLKQIFASFGGQLITDEALMQSKMASIKAFVFDWDGVFNNGQKQAKGSSNFNEVDSMGTNLLRYAYYNKNGKTPVTAIISGEKNDTAFWFCNREKFNYSFFKFANKLFALDFICKQHNLQPNEIAYFFDDVLDLNIAEKCGIRIFVGRKNSPLFNNYVINKNLADYLTSAAGGDYAVREACELLISCITNFNDVIESRQNYSDTYKNYISERNKTSTQYFSCIDGEFKKEEVVF